MKANATLKFARTSPRKARLVADLIRGMHVREAELELRYLNKKAASFFGDVLKSAVANAENNHSLNKANLIISEVLVNEGPFFKRYQPRAFGRAYPILKKTSHITITVSEQKREASGKDVKKETPSKKVKKSEKPAKKEVVKKAKKDVKPSKSSDKKDKKASKDNK
jgi:large subunit ribosomal protein L22